MKVSVQHEGRLMWLANAKFGKYYLATDEQVAAKFEGVVGADQALASVKYFGIPKGKYCFIAEDGTKAWIDEAALLEPSNMISIDIDQEVELKPYQKKAIESMRAGGSVIIDSKYGQPMFPAGEELIIPTSVKKIVKDIASIKTVQKLDALEAENKRLNKELAKQNKESTRKIVDLQEANRNKKPKVEDCLQVLADHYKATPEDVQRFIHIMVEGSWHHKPEQASKTFVASDIDDQFCLGMSKKIADFILDDKRRKLVGVMSIEKAAGIPTSTISNFISAKRDRIPLHHIGSIVKVLEVIGFKA